MKIKKAVHSYLYYCQLCSLYFHCVDELELCPLCLTKSFYTKVYASHEMNTGVVIGNIISCTIERDNCNIFYAETDMQPD